MFAGAASFALAQLTYAPYASGDLAAARTTIMEVFYLTLTVLYVAAHLVFDSRNALRISLAIYASGIVSLAANTSARSKSPHTIAVIRE